MRTPIPTFQVLRNHTIPCPSSLRTRGLKRSLKRVELTDDEKLYILQSLGGQYLKLNLQRQAEANTAIMKHDLINRIRQYLTLLTAASEHGRPFEEETIRRTTQKRDNDSSRAVRSSDSELHVLPPEAVGIRRSVRSLSGAQTSVDYCINRGSRTPDGAYLHLCTTCAATTTLPANHWPRVINEATCGRDNAGCLHADGIEVVIPMNLLRKKIGYCVLATRGNEHVIVDDWEIYTQPIRVGCKCTVDAASFFADFV
ncbi:hypothetical protein NP493_844g00012 [Ridgeia piscesae]|uniref:Uncharacterized protein n=1 Tax=Ridgeia piscesae TaxID=27915 RepID=A0AAD9NML0_RIDPI|nr:hypothetical protein NP493_844g00012 [Ridgeia piscesae]